MALPVIPLAVGAGLLALLALTGSKKPAGAAAPTPVPGGGGASIPPTTPPPPTPGAQPMPAALKAQFDDLLSNGVNADGLDMVANELVKFGFLNEAATLRARAAQLRSAAAAQAATFIPPSQPPAPFPVPLSNPAPTVFVPGVFDGPPAAPSIPNIPIPVVPPPPPAAALVQLAKVTTNDPPPGGDLIMRDSPSDSGVQVPGGGAEKDGLVTIVNENASPDGVWAEIIWPGGTRRPAARGFAKRKFLTKLPPGPAISGIVIGATGTRYAKCVAPSGCRLRVKPDVTSTFRALVAKGETVQVLHHAQGTKADYNSPGPGGWANVKYKNLVGWVPSEWLAAA